MGLADDVRRGRGRSASRGRRFATILGLNAAVVVVLVAVGMFWAVRQIDPGGEPGAEVRIEVARGTSTQGIGTLLHERGIIGSPSVWKWYTSLRGAGGFEAGNYDFPSGISMGDAIEILDRGPVTRYESVTVPEGFRVDQIRDRVANKIPRFPAAAIDDLLASGQIRSTFQPAGVTSSEGILFPDTYRVAETENAADLLRRMVGQLDTLTGQLGYAQSKAKVGLTPYETLIVASLVEREARVPGDRPKIAQVIYNRLAKGMRLQIDATVLYAIGHKERVLFKDLEVDSPYNTYRVSGLPPTPIASPGESSLRAAIEPEPGPWLYYVVVEPDGTHAFGTTLAEHNANIKRAKANGVR